MPTKPHSVFDMKILRRRAKKLLRKKYKKTIKLSTLDKIWKEYCEYAVIRPLLKSGVAQMDSNTKLEIVGKRHVDDPKMVGLMSNGLSVTRNGSVIPNTGLKGHRREYFYKIRLIDDTYKSGQLVYQPDRKLSNRVHKALIETHKYYRIEA